jgi:hypothetical protein
MAVWAGNYKRLPGIIGALSPSDDGYVQEYEVIWDDGDPSHRRVSATKVWKSDHPCSRPLCGASESIPQRHWDEILMDLSGSYDWSEYSLYWGEACISGVTLKRHTRQSPGRSAPRKLYSLIGFDDLKKTLNELRGESSGATSLYYLYSSSS